MSSSVLFLDDNPQRLGTFAQLCEHASLVTTAAEVIGVLQTQPRLDFLFLDHDLGGEIYVDSAREDCGMEVVRYLVDHPSSIGHIVVHTFNHSAGNAMVEALREAGYRVTRALFLAPDFLEFVAAMLKDSR